MHCFIRCKTNVLDNPGNPNEKILKRGRSDLFDSNTTFGECNEMSFKSKANLLLFKPESTQTDGWLMEDAFIFFDDGSYWDCHNKNNRWHEGDQSYYIPCKKIKG